MNEQDRNGQGGQTPESTMREIEPTPRIGFNDPARAEGEKVHLQVHTWEHPHDRRHVNLMQEDYTPEEAARMLGTSLEVIMHAARSGDLKAERQGRDIVCICRADLLDWLNRRGPGV